MNTHDDRSINRDSCLIQPNVINQHFEAQGFFRMPIKQDTSSLLICMHVGKPARCLGASRLRHIDVSHNSKFWPCSRCPQSFTRGAHLKLHVIRVHMQSPSQQTSTTTEPHCSTASPPSPPQTRPLQQDSSYQRIIAVKMKKSMRLEFVKAQKGVTHCCCVEKDDKCNDTRCSNFDLDRKFPSIYSGRDKCLNKNIRNGVRPPVEVSFSLSKCL